MVLLIYEVFILFVFTVVLVLDLNGVRGKHEEYIEKPGYAPKTLVILPAKGYDIKQRQNFSSLKNQDYANYDLVAVVDSADDPAAKTAKQLGISILITKGKCNQCSGKNRAISYALHKLNDYGVYVIADSDIMVKKDWLRHLIAPLSDHSIGISTAFPTFVPIDNGLWSYVKMLWGLVGKSLMSSRATRFGWGGSLAFRNDIIDANLFNMLVNSKYSISDDISITKQSNKKGLSIAYVKDAEPVIYVKETKHSFIEWANRQAALTLLGYKNNLYIGIAYYSAELLLFASGIVLPFILSPVFAVLLLHFVISEYKAFMRSPIRPPMLSVIVILMPALYLYNLLKAASMESITWRGRSYVIKKK